MSTTITRKVPPQRLINMINPVVRRILVSPLHATLDKSILVLHVVGRRTGRCYDIPVSYLDLDGRALVVTQHAWRANLRDVHDMAVTMHGHRRSMHAELEEKPAAVANVLSAAVHRLGWPAVGRQLSMHGSAHRIPSTAELCDAARDYRLATLTLAAD